MAPSPRDLLKTHFGYDSFLPLQERIIDGVLEGRDSLVLMPTGGGKSLCYQLPSLLLDGLTLVVSPLIALMKDQVDALKANGLAADFINSALPYADARRVQSDAVAGRLRILYVAPERLALDGFRVFLGRLRVALIAVDEAHCISEWGHDFRPDYRNLKSLRRRLPDAPVIALTATATQRVREDIVEQLALRDCRIFVSSFNRPNLTYHVRPKRGTYEALLHLLDSRRDEPAIIYRFSRKDTEDLARRLSDDGINALPYHAGLDPLVRRTTQDRFVRDEVSVIVATIAFGMGIDKPDVRLVVHYDMPKSIEGYYQETGRAGRDGLPSDCVFFYSQADRIKHDFFVKKLDDPTEREAARRKLADVVELCELRTCRRRFLLGYFGEELASPDCGGCDVCLDSGRDAAAPGVDEPPTFDATEIAQKVLSAVARTGQRFGAGHVSQVLRGAKTKRVLGLGHDRLSVYGIVRDFSDSDIREIAGRLTERGLLTRAPGDYAVLAITDAGWRFLRDRTRLTLPQPAAGPAGRAGPPAGPVQYDPGLYEKLRALRRSIADEMGVPPYVVFGDTTLQQMAYYIPRSSDSLLRISGVGEAKLARFGDRFLAEIESHATEHGLEERLNPVARSTGRPRRVGESVHETGRLLSQGRSLDEVAAERGLALTTVLGHAEALVDTGQEVELYHVMPEPDRAARIRSAFEAAGTLMLSPVMERLGDGYSYEELRLVRLHLKQRNAEPAVHETVEQPTVPGRS